MALGLLMLTLVGTVSADWKNVPVPGEIPFHQEGWYRAWFKPHSTFFIKHERDLFGESAILNIRGLTGAHEVFINGTQLGTGGSFPPDYQDGSGGNHRHKITSGLLVKDQWNEVLIHTYQPGSKGGFTSEAPFVMNYFWECVMEGEWKFQEGAERPEMKGAVEEKPSIAFDTWNESNRVLGRAEKLVHGEKMSAEASHALMETPEELEVDLMLAEPLVAQPTHFSFDSKGRLWVAQYRQYPYPAGLKMVSRDRYYRSHYDRKPPAPPNHDRGADIVSIHEDTDGDGSYDRNTIFQDGLNMANAVVRGHGGVWVMNTPYLLFYPDADFDDKPDGPPVVHLDGFGMEDTHSVANGLVWGMDGWLYGAQGSTTTCHVRRPGIDDENGGLYFQGCMVWRYHPETRRFEIFAEGGGNNFGLELDDDGRLFTGNNGGQTRGWHYMQGGIHLMQGTTPNKFGPPRNPFAFGTLPKMETIQDIKRFTHFATLVECTALPEKYQGSFFAVDPLHNFVISSTRLEKGATFKTSDIGKVLTSGDFAFRPVFIGNAPDGSVLVADFYEHYIAHGQHYQSQIDPTTGRIFRLRGKGMALEKNLDLNGKKSSELLTFLGHPNKWHRHTAVRLLGERKDPATRKALVALVKNEDGRKALGALWAHYQAFGIDDGLATSAIRHDDPMVRYWGVRLACDEPGFGQRREDTSLSNKLGDVLEGRERVSDAMLDVLLEAARYERNAEVRSQLATSARRLPVGQALPLVKEVLRHSEDLDDEYVPLLCWWVLEFHLDQGREAILDMMNDTHFRKEPMVETHILERLMRAFALKGRNQDLTDAARLLEMIDDANQKDAVLKGFELAYQGRSMGGLPERLAKALVESGRSSLELRLRLGKEDAIKDGIRIAQDTKAKMDQRATIIRTLGELAVPSAMGALVNIATTDKDESLQRIAIAALGPYEDSSIATTLIQSFENTPDSNHAATFDLLLSRKPWTQRLVSSIGKEIPEAAITSEVATRLTEHPDASIARLAGQRLRKNAPSKTPATPEKINELRTMLSKGTGNPYAGEEAFMNRCAVCHRLFHKGGDIGPDLTPYQRGNLETLLTSILDPNAEIREGFEYVSVETGDGRMITGFLTDQDTQVVALRGMAGEDIRVERSNLKSLTPMGRSLMPEGLLAGMSEQELRDFFAYLRISQPITK